MNTQLVTKYEYRICSRTQLRFQWYPPQHAKKTTRGARAIQAFDSIIIQSNLVQSEMAIVL